nr:MAG TPA: Protein of unknown function (DUF1642) [Caudoviricetes sp.]
MNKQELIKEYESIVKDDSLELCGCYNMADKNFMRKIYKSVLEDLEQLDEPQKITIPQVVADWIEWTKKDGLDLQDAMNLISGEENEKLLRWFYHENKQETFARAWLDGYEIEKEKRYIVKVKGVEESHKYLNHRISLDSWFFSGESEPLDFSVKHTRKELEEAGFEEVFNSPLFEVKEVEE